MGLHMQVRLSDRGGSVNNSWVLLSSESEWDQPDM